MTTTKVVKRKTGHTDSFKGIYIMRVTIEDTCTACGLCVDTCPDVFEMGDDTAEVIIASEVPAEFEDAVQQAAADCPVEAIVVA